MTSPAKASRFAHPVRGHNTRDDTGLVRVVIMRYDNKIGAPVRGNIVRTVSVRDAKVSDVASVVKGAIFPNG